MEREGRGGSLIRGSIEPIGIKPPIVKVVRQVDCHCTLHEITKQEVTSDSSSR
ncbi:unnamed protein product [Dovyalis caffra]|uniref:Uncharacterized protein n=1 Tax=Dovyalis caffra TaxID=77055 RepID=A0AAV1SC10_9ROSI|nr:unnamed protein product [Dovyalis caffra]